RIRTPISYRYFFLDALVCLDKGFGGALKLKGFGGGVYYHMNRPAASMPLTTGCTGNPTIPPGLGQSLSGLQYTPDRLKGLGIKATVSIAAALKESAFNGNATLELLFNTGGGLSDIWIYGNARFMETPNVTASTATTPPTGSSVGATLDIHLDFNNHVLHGELDVYLNVANGAVHGTGPSGLFAHAVLHVETQQNGIWYIKIGTPSNRAGLAVDIPIIGNIGNIGAYLEIGKDLDPMPPLPSDIAALTGLNGTAGLSNRDGAMGGNGFIFGADLNIGNQDMTFLIFYAGIRARLGFDIALLDYGSGAVCANTGQQVGINGWYASGQAYAGLWGEMGIKVKIFGKRKKFKIFQVAVAAALQASLPNPFWAKGAVGGHYEILGGLIKGDCNFDVTIGEKCQITGADDPLGEIAVVQRISPENGTTGVATNGKPEVYFNFPMNQTFALQDPNGNSVNYKAIFESAKIRYYGLNVSATVHWADDKRSLILEPDWILPGNDTIEVVVKSHVDSSGITIYEEERIAQLVTGPGLTYIPASNVQGSYPFDGQFNFFPDQIQDRQGYILLKHGQPDLFWNQDEDEHFVVRFKKHCGQQKDVPLAYATGTEKISFEIPQGYFTSGGIYRMQVMRIGSGGGSGNSSSSLAKSTLAEMPGTCPETLNSNETVLYTAYFRTSQYASFGAKIAAWNAAKTVTNVGNLLKAEAPIEPFAPSDLVSIQPTLLSNSWYLTNIVPNLYWEEEPCVVYGFCLDENGFEGLTPIEFKPKDPNPPAIPVITQAHWLAESAPGATVNMEMQYKALNNIQTDWKSMYDQIKAYIASIDLVAEIASDPHPEKCASGLSGLCKSTCTTFKSEFPLAVRQIFCQGPTMPAPPSGDYTIVLRYLMPGTTNWWGSEQVITLHKN
ncbi:MAG: Ig-like domain-containing protein, partial [Saprospiraceae bacterium]